MKAFVTGATGFIGRHLVERLIDGGVEVTALVRKRNHDLPPAVNIVYGDILDPQSFAGSCRYCRRVYHLAAQISFNPRLGDQLAYINGEGTANVMAAVARYKVEKTVVVSSACTVGLTYEPNQILDETASLNEMLLSKNPYLASKTATERAVKESDPDTEVIIVNPTTVYGPGDWNMNSGTLIKSIAKMPVVPVPSGGSNVIDVVDVVNGILKAGENGRSGNRYILGGANLTFAEIFYTVAEVIEHSPFYVKIPKWMKTPLSKSVGVLAGLSGSNFITGQIIDDLFSYKFYSNKLARETLDWQPNYNFKQSVLRAWKFYQNEGLIS